MKKALIHRYNRAEDIAAVAAFGCSDFPDAADGSGFEILIVVPTGEANSEKAVWGWVVGSQEQIQEQLKWPAGPRDYGWRTRMRDVQPTTLSKVRQLVIDSGQQWRAQWTQMQITIDESQLLVTAVTTTPRPAQVGPTVEAELARITRELDQQCAFDPQTAREGRKRVLRSIAERRGQAKFRERLLAIYGGRCAVTGTTFPEALEAAHIRPYDGDYTNHPQNGILLRGDIHTLFDLGHLTIDESYRIRLSATLRSTDYGYLEGRSLHLPDDSTLRPSLDALALHKREASEQGIVF